MSIDVYSAEEHQRVIDAEQRYGDYYVNAYNSLFIAELYLLVPAWIRSFLLMCWRRG